MQMSATTALSRNFLEDSAAAMSALVKKEAEITAAAHQVTKCLARGGTVFACGNGGSASDAQHFVAELVGRFETKRRGLRAIALNVDTSVLTSVANDFSYCDVFARQISALGRKGDLLVGISTSGRSPNVLKALDVAQAEELDTLLLTGEAGAGWGGSILRVPAERTAIIQQLHIAVLHIFCLVVDAAN